MNKDREKKFKYTIFEGTENEFCGNLKEIVDRFSNGEKYIAVYNRLKRGWSLEEALGLKERKYPRIRKFYDYKGEKKTMNELIQLTGLKKSTIFDRISKMKPGEKLEDKLHMKRNNARVYKCYDIEGTVSELAEHFGVSMNKIYRGINSGLEIEDAIKKKNNKLMVEYNGEKINLYKLAKKFNINPSTIRRRYYNSMQLEEMLVPSNRYIYEYNGFSGTIMDFARKYDIKESVLYYRVRKRGESIEAAIEYAIKKYKKA